MLSWKRLFPLLSCFYVKYPLSRVEKENIFILIEIYRPKSQESIEKDQVLNHNCKRKVL